MAHLDLVDKMCKYELDQDNIVENTEQIWFLSTDGGQTDRRMDKVKPVYPPSNFIEAALRWGRIN